MIDLAGHFMPIDELYKTSGVTDMHSVKLKAGQLSEAVGY